MSLDAALEAAIAELFAVNTELAGRAIVDDMTPW